MFNFKMKFPTLITERLKLNQPTENDIQQIAQILGEDKVYTENTLNIPYPYSLDDAEFFIKEICIKSFENGDAYIWAIRQNDKAQLIGVIELSLDLANAKAEAGYWLSKEYWNKGLATEALHKVIIYGFDHLEFNKIYATHHLNNPASGKVMQKSGMKLEGILKQEVRKGDRFLDLVRYSILKDN